MDRKRKTKLIVICIALVLIVSFLYIIGYTCSCSSNADVQDSIVQVVFNDCHAYEKLGEDFVENSEHEIGSEIYDVDDKHLFSEIHIDGYEHIHYLLPRRNGGYYCAAIGNDGIKYLLSLNNKKIVDSFVQVSNLPAKLFEAKDGLVVYYISDGEAKLYSVDFTSGRQNLLVDGISIYGSRWSGIMGRRESEQEFFDLYEYKYEEYIKSGKDLLFTLFDEKCFENVHINDTSIVYKTAKSKDKQEWTVKHGEEKICFSNGDRCFGFVGESELMFYKCLSLGLYDVGLFYKYDYIKEKKLSFEFVLNQGIIKGESFEDKRKFYFTTADEEYYCMDTETGKCYRILKGCPVIGYFTRMREGRFW